MSWFQKVDLPSDWNIKKVTALMTQLLLSQCWQSELHLLVLDYGIRLMPSVLCGDSPQL